MVKVKRILVCGGRGYSDRATFNRCMEEAKTFFDDRFCIIEGGATGADRFAKDWAFGEGCAIMNFPPNWAFYGNKAAGPMRNKWMLDFGQPELVIAFPGHNGTRDMMRQARERGIVVWEPVRA